MRTREARNYSGYFWLPSEPENKIPGQLFIINGGEIELEIAGLFGEKKLTQDQEEFHRIIGNIEKHGNITLDDCFYKIKNSFSGGILKSKIICNVAYLGIAFKDDISPQFENISFEIDGLDEWLGITGIKVDKNKDNNTVTISYSPIKTIKFDISDELQIGFTFGYTIPNEGFHIEAKINQKAYIRLLSKKRLNTDEISTIIHRLVSFFSFTIGKNLSIGNLVGKSLQYKREITKSKTIEIAIPIIYQTVYFDEKIPTIKSHEMLLNFSAMENRIDQVLSNWINAYERLSPALDLYFSVKNGGHRHSETKFLALAQGLETYHRRTFTEKPMHQEDYDSLVEKILEGCPEEKKEWLLQRLKNGNELNLRKRLVALIKPYGDLFGNSNKRATLVSKITDTRNYLTHYNEDLEEKTITGFDLMELCDKMEVIFNLHFLSIIGYSKEESITIARQSRDMTRLLNFQI